jgi:hypothetical protein
VSINLEDFSVGLGVIALKLNQPVTAEMLKAYHSGFEAVTDPVEWEAFCKAAPIRFRWTFIPKEPQLFDALMQYRGAPSVAELDRQLSTEAGEAYQRVMDSGIYTAEGGTSWNYRTVVEKCGRAAGEAFVSAGGNEAFRVTDEKWNHDKRRNAFMSAYQVAVRESPEMSMRALPAPKADEQKQLTSGAADPQLTEGEAKGFLDKLRKHLPPGEIPEAPKGGAFAVNCPPDRYEQIKAEAEKILRTAALAESKVS